MLLFHRRQVRANRVRVGERVQLSGRYFPVVAKRDMGSRVELELDLAEDGDVRPIPFFLLLSCHKRVVRRHK